MSAKIKIIIVDADSGHTVKTLIRIFPDEADAATAAEEVRSTIDVYCIAEEE